MYQYLAGGLKSFPTAIYAMARAIQILADFLR
jgi:hypothetical protein